MRIAELSTALPLLAPGEPSSPDAGDLPLIAQAIILSAAGGTLRRCGTGWYGPDKQRPFPMLAVRGLIARGLLFRCSRNAARLTPTRGRWLARSLCSAIAANSFATVAEGEPCRIVA